MGVTSMHPKDMEVKMSVLPGFLLTIAKAAPSPEKKENRTMSIIIRRPYAFLEKELRSVFKGQEDVTVIVDRRYTERRRKVEPAPLERRRADRRRSKEQLLEVLVSI
jgi:hypothetical protein